MEPDRTRLEQLEHFIVTAAQMSAIEGRVFAAGMPVAALMEKVAGLVARRIAELYPNARKVGVLVGPGHNGGDALVVARELLFRGYSPIVYRPIVKSKELTEQHARYAASLGIPFMQEIYPLLQCDVLIDGLFGFGLERSIGDPLAGIVDRINQNAVPVVSIDIPSGIHTDTGAVLGTAIRATHTLCLGLWKLAFCQERALEYLGTAELIDFDIPLPDIRVVLGTSPEFRRLTKAAAIAPLPLSRPPNTHKYKQGHLLLICGSRRYTGAALLAGLGARATGVGMLSIAVPQSLKLWLNGQLPEALILGCPETETGAILPKGVAGAIANLPPEVDLGKYDAIAAGPGLTTEALSAIEAVWNAPCPLVLDADGLNILTQLGTFLPKEPPMLRGGQQGLRNFPTIFTPHAGEFKRLFPELGDRLENPPIAAQEAARQSGAIVALKGARTAIAHPNGTVWLNSESTPALARGGTGDVLTGLIGGLVAQAAAGNETISPLVSSAVWWHSQAALLAVRDRSELGVDAFTLTQYLGRVFHEVMGNW
ncbi:MAG TPA: NAD(P)H-hydrate dehydratase [Oscillatoriales cyanobacterium M4454_W2019_049]|nr:NAD(P)H-hydrate dehydratase [Oscillatoriales cyanobacterium M4454_W2019_049]